MVILNDRGHETKLEIVDDEFVELCVNFEKACKLIIHTASLGCRERSIPEDFHRWGHSGRLILQW